MIIRTLRSLVPDPPDPAAPHTPPGLPIPVSSLGQQHAGQGAPNQHPGRHGGLEHIDIL